MDEVLLHASVVDDKQHIITTLDRNAFTVFEDGKPQNIISFHNVDIPVAMGIVIDNSGSMREKRNKVNQAALNLVRSSNPKDEVFVVNFNDEYYLDQDFTNNLLKLKEALEKIDARGGTALYDAVVASAEHLKKFARLEKKVLFVVTDGEDNASNETLEQAIKHLQEENGPSVYAIGILGDEEHPKRARKALDVIAQRTGGIAFFPKTLDEVDEISRTVARDIRNQYAIGYRADESAREWRVPSDSGRGQGQGAREDGCSHQERVLCGRAAFGWSRQVGLGTTRFKLAFNLLDCGSRDVASNVSANHFASSSCFAADSIRDDSSSRAFATLTIS